MKNKLKWLGSLPAVAIVASVPIALASCKSNYVEPVYSTTITEGYDDPEVISLEKEGQYNQQEVTDLYLSTINEDPMMFVKDMTCAAAFKYTDFANVFLDTDTPYKDPDGSVLQKCEFGFSIPKFGQTSVWEMGFEDSIYTTISFKQRIYLEYLYQDPDGKTQIIKTISADIDYNNVLFMISESDWHNLDVETSTNWLIGVIDPWFQTDAFWVYQYNTNPWSINYGFSYEVTKTIFGSPDVTIHNCTYYSGNVDTARKLFNLWNYSKRLETRERVDTPCEVALECMMIKCILCMEYGSKILANVVNKPDVCISDQLQGVYRPSVTPGQASLFGITFIYPKTEDFDPSPTKITIKLRDYNDDIVCKGVTSPEKIVTIAKDQELETGNSNATSHEFRLPVSVNEGIWNPGDIFSFDVPYRSLKISITYQNKAGQPQYSETELFLHYNAFVLKYPENEI